MIHKKKLKLFDNNYNIPPPIHPFDRQNNYINLVRKSLNPETAGTVDLKMTDEEGLQKAYATPSGIYTFGNRMFIAGTRDLNDVKDDILRIPGWGNSRNIQRYKDARDELMKHPEVTSVTGHSLGGSVALELQKNYRHIQSSRTYGAPVWDYGEATNTDRYRNYGDPISYFDKNANTTTDYSVYDPRVNHGYTSLGKQFDTTKTVNIASTNPDGSTSLIA